MRAPQWHKLTDAIPDNSLNPRVPAFDRQQVGGSFQSSGVVAANFDASDANEEIAVDFGMAGVWLLKAETWSQITEDNPSWIFGVNWGGTWKSDLIADFDTEGLWAWDYEGGQGRWALLSGADAQGGIAIDDDGDGREELQVDFGPLGLWRYDLGASNAALDGGTWSSLRLEDSTWGVRADIGTTGREEGIWHFVTNHDARALSWDGTAPIDRMIHSGFPMPPSLGGGWSEMNYPSRRELLRRRRC